jgi:hypothetical protein
MFMFHEHYSKQNLNIKRVHKFFENVENFHYFGTYQQINLAFIKRLRTR